MKLQRKSPGWLQNWESQSQRTCVIDWRRNG